MTDATSDSSLDLAPPAKPKLRGLWELMPEADAARGDAVEAAPVEVSNEAKEGTVGDPVADGAELRPRGLWSLMESAVEAPPAPAGRPLWEVMGAARAPDAAPTDSQSTEPSRFETPGTEVPRVESPPTAAHASTENPAASQPTSMTAPPAPVVLIEAPPSVPTFNFEASASAVAEPASSPSSTARLAALAGVASIPLSALALVDTVWGRVPAMAVGFFGLAAGLAAWNEIIRPRSRYVGKPVAIVAVVCGVVGMFLGPLVFSPLGRWHRESTGPKMTMRHAAEVGQALGRYVDAQQQYPAGGSVGPDTDGNDRPLHGWMARLLPFLGQESLAAQIDFTKPFDDEVNRPAMRRPVPSFLATGHDAAPVVGGFAPSHFAGVGGQIVRPGQGIVHLGVFDRNSAVRPEQIVDGLSQTLIVGEVAHRYPAWGDPENWRGVGKGLNRDPRGFGNVDGTGAVFLKADGSVRFFSTKTSPDVLLKLTTRDGNDVPDEP